MSFKKLRNSDVILLPYVANKTWSFSSASLTENSIVVYDGTKDDSRLDLLNDSSSNGYYEKILFRSVNHLFYQEFSGSFLDSSSLLQTNYYLSASNIRPSGSYYDYRTFSDSDKAFATASVKIISIPKKLFGTGIKKGTFRISSSFYDVQDDSRGNIYDAGTNPITSVGNIFYSHGLVVITNGFYQNMFNDLFVPQGDFSNDFSDDFYV